MKVKFLKNHVTYKSGETVDLPEAQANYLTRTGVAEATKKSTDTDPETEKVKVERPVTEKVEKPSKPAVKEKKTISKPVTKKSK